MQESVDCIEHEQIVIEILEDIPITVELIERLKQLKNAGNKLALDDFVINEEVLIYDELFRQIDYIKIDFLHTGENERAVIENTIKSKFPHIKLLAEKVETREQYEMAKQSGYFLFCPS